MTLFITFIKARWKIILSVVLALLVLAAFIKKRDDNYVKEIETLRASQEKEIKQINDARDQEKKQFETIDIQHQQEIAAITKNFQKTYLELQALKKTKEAEILKDKDPRVLARKLSDAMGLRVQP